MNYYSQLSKTGFIHIKNIFDNIDIKNICNSLQNVNFDDNIIDCDAINIDYEIINDKPVKKSLKYVLLGINHNINCNEKDIIQLYSTNIIVSITSIIQHFENRDLPEEQQIGYLIYKKHYSFIENIIVKNSKLIEKLLNKFIINKIIDNVKIISIKYFKNKPNCSEQEIHCDEPIPLNYDLNLESYICIIPLNKNINGGTTVLYDNKYVNKFKNVSDKNSLFNIAYVDDLDKDIKKFFLKGRYETIFDVRDIVIFKGDTFHHGTKNKSNFNREFLYVQLEDIKPRLEPLSLNKSFFQ